MHRISGFWPPFKIPVVGRRQTALAFDTTIYPLTIRSFYRLSISRRSPATSVLKPGWGNIRPLSVYVAKKSSPVRGGFGLSPYSCGSGI